MGAALPSSSRFMDARWITFFVTSLLWQFSPNSRSGSKFDLANISSCFSVNSPIRSSYFFYLSSLSLLVVRDRRSLSPGLASLAAGAGSLASGLASKPSASRIWTLFSLSFICCSFESSWESPFSGLFYTMMDPLPLMIFFLPPIICTEPDSLDTSDERDMFDLRWLPIDCWCLRPFSLFCEFIGCSLLSPFCIINLVDFSSFYAPLVTSKVGE